MLIDIKLDMRIYQTKANESKYDFWRRFQAAKEGLSQIKAGEATFDTEEIQRADELDAQFVSQFPIRLQERVNDELRRSFAAHPKLPAPAIGIRLVRTNYHSLHALLELTGIDNASLREFVLSVLTIYTPSVFQEVMNAPNIGAQAVVTLAADDLGILAAANLASTGSGVAASRTSDVLNRTWLIANTSLVVPVVLALGICYYAFSALNHELDAARAQAALAQTEQAEIMKVLQAQNAKLSDLVAAHPANNDNFKAFTEILLAVVKSSSDRPAPSVRPTTNTSQ
jgi:hypothetical protein